MGSGGPVEVAGVKLTDALADSGTALLCASEPRDPAKAPIGMTYTMFTGALLDVLKIGDERAPPTLSLQDLAYLVKRSVEARFKEEAVRPEVHAPDQKGGRVDTVPIFPNSLRRHAEEKQRAEVAWLAAEEKRKADEAARLAEEKRKADEAARREQQAEAPRLAKEQQSAATAPGMEENWRPREAEPAQK